MVEAALLEGLYPIDSAGIMQDTGTVGRMSVFRLQQPPDPRVFRPHPSVLQTSPNLTDHHGHGELLPASDVAISQQCAGLLIHHGTRRPRSAHVACVSPNLHQEQGAQNRDPGALSCVRLQRGSADFRV